jgi:ankyrin repeat protein
LKVIDGGRNLCIFIANQSLVTRELHGDRPRKRTNRARGCVVLRFLMRDVSNVTRPLPVGFLFISFLLAIAIVSVSIWPEAFLICSDTKNAAPTTDYEALLMDGAFANDPAMIHRALRSHVACDGMVTLALVTSITLGNEKSVAQFIRDGAPVDGRTYASRTPLILAAGIPGNEPIAKMLLDAGADPNVVSSFGETPMSEAVKSGDKSMIELIAAARRSTQHD